MFKLNPAPSFWATVLLTVPGEPERSPLELLLAHKPVDDLRAWIGEARTKRDLEVIGGIVLDWRGADEAFSSENLRLLLQNYPAAGAEIFEGYLKALTESRAKN